jgi:hypothetical protein
MASPVKLSDGTWGARVPGIVFVGQNITIETRAGKKWTACVAKIISKNSDGAIVQTKSATEKKSGQSSRSNCGYWLCPACEEENSHSRSSCWECGCGRK